jgi:FMN phosphatase YigB (HAD superfamily)
MHKNPALLAPTDAFLIFDFDGVLLDSLDEVILNSYRIVNHSKVSRLEQLPPLFWQRMRLNRFHVQPAADFLPLAQWAFFEPESSGLLLTRELFEALIARELQPEAVRRQIFFAQRDEFFRSERSAWYALNRPYQPLWDWLRARVTRSAIVTNKNAQAVKDLCAHFELPFATNQIFAGDSGLRKAQMLQQVQRAFPAAHYVFLEDSVRNLVEVQHELPANSAPLSLLVASWGYVGADDLLMASRHGFEILQQQDFCSHFGGDT